MAARNSSASPSDQVRQAAVAAPKSPVLAADPVMQGANMVVPMPLREPVMTVPPQGRPVMAPLPFPVGPPSFIHDAEYMMGRSLLPAGPHPMTALQPPPAGYMMGHPLLRASPLPMTALHLPHDAHMMARPPLPVGPPLLKRRRPDYFDMPFGQEMPCCEQEMAGFDESMALPYGPYINNEMSSVGSYEPYLPSDASNTLHVEGLPSNCTRRELAHIFRPFTGFCAVRLVNTGYNSRHVIAYVDFGTPAQAFSAMKSLQGYLFDMHDRYSLKLDLQFLPGPRSTDGSWHVLSQKKEAFRPHQ
ncbi:basic salivary proline-rich protein 2-like [Hordeum vulgare]|nr:basic salivary proline-rich protein 2-like [Hordeum vulgare]